MKGLLLRDGYLLRQRPVLLMLVGFVGIVLLFSFITTDEETTVANTWPFSAMISLFTTGFSLLLLYEDEQNKWLNYCKTTPVRDAVYVLEKYLMALIFSVFFGLILTVLPLVVMLRQDAFAWADFWLSLVIPIGMSFLCVSLMYPLTFRFGTSKGFLCFLVIFVLLAVGVFVGGLAADFSNGGKVWKFLTALENGKKALYGILIAAGLFGLSLPISIGCFRKRQF